MRATVAIFLATFLVAPASAQWTNCTSNGPFANCFSSNGAITNCSQVGNITNCNTMGGQQAASGDGGAGLVDAVNAIRAAHQRRVEAKLTTAIQAGDCNSAVVLAGQTHNVDTMMRVKQYCDGQAVRAAQTAAAQQAPQAPRVLSPYELGRLAGQQQQQLAGQGE